MSDQLLTLLAQARRLNNQTVRSSQELAHWHTEVDAALRGTKHDDPDERFDAPHRADHRRYINRLFHRSKH